MSNEKQWSNLSASDINSNKYVTLGTHLDPTNDKVAARKYGYPYTTITTATTTTIKSTAGIINRIVATGGGTLGNVQILDGTTVMFESATPIAGQVLLDGEAFATDLSIITSAATHLTVSYI